MSPLKITFNLVGPMERAHRPTHLDSLIASLIFDKKAPYGADEELAKEILENLPFERGYFGDEWVWKASTIAFNWISQPTQQMGVKAVRAHDIHRMQQMGIFSNLSPKTTVDTNRGIFKSAVYAHEMQEARQGVAYCIGNEKKLTKLLKKLDQIGARRRNGAGKIASINIEEDENAHEFWKRRYLPVSANDGIRTEGSYKLPMYAIENRTEIKDNHLRYENLALAI